MDAKKADEIRQTLLGLISECKDKKVTFQFLVNVIALETLQKLDQGADEKIVEDWTTITKLVASRGTTVVEKALLDALIGEAKIEEKTAPGKAEAVQLIHKVCSWFGI